MLYSQKSYKSFRFVSQSRADSNHYSMIVEPPAEDESQDFGMTM